MTAEDDTPENDQSMDDILASIRRIMLDEQARLQDSGAAGKSGNSLPVSVRSASSIEGAETVLVLDSSMAVGEVPEPRPLPVVIEPPIEPLLAPQIEQPAAFMRVMELAGPIELLPPDPAALDVPLVIAQEPAFAAETTVQGPAVQPAAPVGFVTQQAIEALLAPAAAAAAAASVEALLRQLNEERRSILPSGPSAPSLTIEEVVRSELRPFLKSWLDENLPPMVESMVRVEINRLIGRTGL
jgi:cell pole-organizing protein PopZ